MMRVMRSSQNRDLTVKMQPGDTETIQPQRLWLRSTSISIVLAVAIP